MWLNFITFNSVAPLSNLHLISDAGAGEGLMQLHPSRDTELIACGKANTLLNGEYLPSPLLGNGSVTPAILVHGIFKALQSRGHKIRLHCYQLGLAHTPDFTDSCMDEIVVEHCQLGQEKKLIEQILLPELKRQQAMGERHLVAESGIGGTTYASLWLQHWLKMPLSFAGSTKDPQKLAVKRQIIQDLLEQTVHFPLDITPFISSLEWSDPIQRACCALLASDLTELHFAGGAMIFAPVIATQSVQTEKKISIATTRWVMESPDSQYVATHLPPNCHLELSSVNFNQSCYDAIRMYERGFVIEGCGLGACLVFAEQQGLTQQEIILNLDNAVTPWLLESEDASKGASYATMY